MISFFVVMLPRDVVTIHDPGVVRLGEMDVAGVWVWRFSPALIQSVRRCMKSLYGQIWAAVKRKQPVQPFTPETYKLARLVMTVLKRDCYLLSLLLRRHTMLDRLS